MILKRMFIALLLVSPILGRAQETASVNLLPLPKTITAAAGIFRLDEHFTVAIREMEPDTILVMAVNRMYQTLNRRSGVFFRRSHIGSTDKTDTAALQISVQKAAVQGPGGDESYRLSVTPQYIRLDAPTTSGAMHGLETLLQLLSRTKEGEPFFPCVLVEDAPRFPWRGLMIDVSRHFIPMDVLERNIAAMAAVKMNVLHLHLSDNEGFRVESNLFPGLQNKGSRGEYYTQASLKSLVQFAKVRGITIVPEFDMPGHTKSWFAGYPQLASAPGPYEPGPPVDMHSVQQMNFATIMQLMNTAPFPAMDPSKESTYEFIDKFVGEMCTIFPSSWFHIGADENNGVVWKNNPSIVAFMKEHHIPDTHALQAYFVERVSRILAKHHRQMTGWEELFSKNLPKEVMVQVWQNPSYLKQALGNGNPVIISKGFYLDLFMPAHVHYNNPDLPAGLPDSLAGRFRGGEAAQWTEIADRRNIETRIWPRAAAIAERLWSPAEAKDAEDMYRRLFLISGELDDLGLQHISDYERSLRSLAGNDISSVRVLTDVLTPVKGYKKLFAKIMMPESMSYQTAPLTQVSDIVFVDSRVRWEFRAAVRSFLETKDSVAGVIIENDLASWLGAEDKLKSLMAGSSALRAVDQHAKNLSLAAGIGIAAWKKLKAGESPDANWVGEQMKLLKPCSQAYGETEISIIPEIEALVQRKLNPLPATYPLF